MHPSQPLWLPTEKFKKQTNLYKFLEFTNFHHFDDLYQWSIQDIGAFWDKVWGFCNIIGDPGTINLLHSSDIQKAVFYPEARLNYAENLLRRRDESIAIYFFDEKGEKQHIRFCDLYNQVSQFVQQLQAWGIGPGDRVAGYLPNIPQTVIAMLATTTLGAIWSSCSPDFGVQSVLDRFIQIEPKVLLICDGYFYNGKIHSCLDRLPQLLASLPTVKHIAVVSYATLGNASPYHDFEEIINSFNPSDIEFEQVPFNHPLFIMFSSGTTGKPKCIVHSVGGTLIQHMKEHQLHCDIKRDDRVFYYTTCSWMMWHWLVSSLASEASIILYDGSPVFPKIDILFDIAVETSMTLLGTSAKYLSTLEKEHLEVHQDLSKLRTMTSTGSPLSPSTFEYVYSHIKQNVHLASISGGTDIISCFMLGNPLRNVYAGQLQGAGLGMAVDVFDDQGRSIKEKQGELVCIKPFPSQPIGFWKDHHNEKYHQAYFSKFPHVWHHGDFLEHTKEDGFIVYGRSDTVLNPGGVRIGTAEIYEQVEMIEEVIESLAVDQKWQGDTRIILFVVLKPERKLTEALIYLIKQRIRSHTTPRHVPAKIIQVNELPKTNNGKLAEIAVRQTIHGQEAKNRESLINPESLKQFVGLKELEN